MSIWFTLMIVTFGISGIVALVHFTGGSARARLLDKSRVVALWNRQFPDRRALNVVLEPDGLAALIELTDNGTGLLWAFGDKVVGRVLDGGQLKVRADTLRIDLPDFTAPRLSITISQPLVRRVWVETLNTVLEENT